MLHQDHLMKSVQTTMNDDGMDFNEALDYVDESNKDLIMKIIDIEKYECKENYKDENEDMLHLHVPLDEIQNMIPYNIETTSSLHSLAVL